MTSLRSKIAVTVLGLVLVGSLAGCTSGPGQAVSGNGFSYSESDVSTVIAEYAELTGNTASEIARSNVVIMLGEATTFFQLAEELGIEVTDEEFEAAVVEAAESSGSSLTVDDLSPVTVTVLKASLVSGELYTSLTDYSRLQELLLEADIELNPRYGVFQEGVLTTSLPLGDVLSEMEKMFLGVDLEDLESMEETGDYSTETESGDDSESTETQIDESTEEGSDTE